MKELIVKQIQRKEVVPWLLKKHYAHRRCPVSYAYGMYRNKLLIGVVTYGTPLSSPLKRSICGKKWKNNVLELNRLCCENSKNIASQLIGKSLKMLPRPSIIVSYADTEQGHVGYVYQATNFLYTGLSVKRCDYAVKGKEHLHNQTIMDMSRRKTNRVEWLKQKFGDDLYMKERPQKHRYVFFAGSKTQKKELKKI